jgi:hypothetical protein
MANDRKELLKVMKKAYRKHVMDDPEVGWEELSGDIRGVLRDVMGIEDFDKFVEECSEDVPVTEV